MPTRWQTFAFRIFFKMQRTNDEVISQINDLNA